MTTISSKNFDSDKKKKCDIDTSIVSMLES